MNHPIQPLATDGNGVLRFKENAIVRFLLDCGPFDLNHIAMRDFSQEDREQFAQLIGYSLSGFGELGFVSDGTYEAAAAMAEDPTLIALQARVEQLQATLDDLRETLRNPVARLFGKHPDDFA